jgi:FtsH-binding integral membrane protein
MRQQYQGQLAGGYAPGAVANASVDSRAKFISRTYNHLLGAIALFTGIEVVLFKTGIAYKIAGALAQNWLFVLGGFMVASWLASRAAHRSTSLSSQYFALVAFVAVEAVVFVPLLVVANLYAPGAIQSAGIVTLLGFAGLTGIAFWTRKDFSFLGGVLKWVGICALALIVGGILFGFELGTFFSVAMVAFAGGAILYDTSNVLHHFPEDRYVGAALELFASVALMFWYVLRIFIAARD